MANSQTSGCDLEASEAFYRDQAKRQVDEIRGRLAGEAREFCVDCDDPIGEARLAALPNAVRCIHCQGALEAEERRELRT